MKVLNMSKKEFEEKKDGLLAKYNRHDAAPTYNNKDLWRHDFYAKNGRRMLTIFEDRTQPELIKVTQEQWDKIPNDYKGQWESWHKEGGWQPDLPDEWIGKRTVMEGCIVPGAGTALLTESAHFEIV